MPRRERPLPDRKAPELPPTKAAREAKVGSIKIDASVDITIESGRPRILMAVPLDQDGNPIHGLLAQWESSDKNIISITTDGRAVAGNPGKARLTASAGQKQVSLKVTVIEAASVTQNSVAAPPKTVASLQAAKEARRDKHHPRFIFPTPQDPQLPGSRLPDAEAGSLYWTQNDVGAPPGRTEPGAATPPAAISGTETPLSANFAFGVPLVSLPGRGVNTGLALSYNSRLWHKSLDSGATRMTYDVDAGWPAPGFQLGYGHIESHGAAGLTLVEADGTRRELRKANSNPYDYSYDTVDGTFIHFTSSAGYYPTNGWLYRPDGSKAYYFGGAVSYPEQIMDRNGNYILISYLGWGLINTITDTLGRYLTFNYEYDPSQDCGPNNPVTSQCFRNARKLVSIGSPSGTVRFYYDTNSINQTGSFTVPTRAPATARVLRYVYFAGMQSGYRFDYSSYGMISVIKQLRGMTVSTTIPNQQGTVTSDGQIAATTSYNYPLTPASLSDAPVFTQRTDDWAGRTSSLSIYNFSVNQAAGTSAITAPNGTITTTQSTVAQGSWNDGLVTDITQQGGGLTVTAHNTWQTDSGGINPRLQQTQATNEANQTRTTQFTYANYNNVSVINELGFNNEELRRTETTYQTDSYPPDYPWGIKRILRLPTSVKIFAGGVTQPASRVDYAYDQEEPMVRYGIVMHDDHHDPSSPNYNQATNFRGNLTSITWYINAADPNQGTLVDTKDYDMAGNLVAQTANCCRQKAYDYFSGYYFANVTQLTEGDSQHQQSAVYDFNTGQITQSTDQNGQVTTYEYYPDTKRLYRVTRPDGGTTIIEYGDLLYADPDQSHLHSWTKTTTSIEGSTVAEEWKYMDGRGQVVRTFGTQTGQGRATRDVEYDAMGRVVRKSNPYYSSSGAASAINPAGIWASRLYDPLSRVTRETLPDSTTAQTSYLGNVTTVMDQANKSRRRVTDALGRLARMDEPDALGNLGPVSSPTQPTTYEYDALDNLVHITQGAQHRYFKFDSLSRMTYERQPEQAAPHAATDPLTSNTNWSRKIDYNGFSLVSQVTDARSVATNFTYDTLNRLTTKTYSDSSPSVQLSYDEARSPDGGGEAYSNRGRLTTVSAGSGQIYQQFNYNRMGKVVMQRQSVGGNAFEIQYSYNPGGQLIEEWVRGELPQSPPSYLPGYSVDEKRSFFYDVAGRLTSVNRGSHSAPQAAYASTLSYHATGALESLTYGNGAVETKSFNSRMQLTSQSLVKAGTVLQRYEYQYGQVNQSTGAVDVQKNNGQLARTDGFIGGTPQSPVKQWDERFSYDALGRLDVASEYRGDNNSLSWQTDYDYDRYGNRTSVSGVGYMAHSGSANPGSAGILPATSAQLELIDPSLMLQTAQLRRGVNIDIRRDSGLRHSSDVDKGPTRAHHARASKLSIAAAASPQGPPSKIAFASNRDGSAQIYTMNTDGSGQTRATINDSNDESPRWSPDDSRIIFQSDRDHPFCGVADIYVMNADGSGQTRLTTDDNDDSAAVWSPDGSKVAFQSLRNGVNYQVYVMKADGSDQVNLSNSTANEGQPSWSPDGTKLAFSSDRDAPGRPSIYVMNANGSNQTRLTFTSAPFKDEQPAWSPDGARIAFVSTRDSIIETWTETDDEGGILTRTAVRTNKEVYLMNADGANQVRLTNTLENDDSPGWSADGTRLLYRSDRERECCDPVAQVWIMDPDGSDQINLSNNEYGDYGASWQKAGGNVPPTVSTTSYDSATNRITTAGITYDAAGQTLTDAIFRGLQYQYNPEGRMIWSANLDGSNPSTSVYDGLGQRVQTSQAGVTKTFFYDINGSVVAEYEANGGTGYGALKQLNVSGAGRLLAVDEVQTNGTKVTSYRMADRQGSTRVLMDAAGAVTSRHDYLPFGEELGAGTGAPGSPTGMRTAAQGYSVADSVRQRYADTRLDDATGLDHTLWRKLETRSGRWTTPDPYGKSLTLVNPQSFNRYAYVHNDPVNLVDPSGLAPDDIINGPCGNLGICNVIFRIPGAGGVGGGARGGFDDPLTQEGPLDGPGTDGPGPIIELEPKFPCPPTGEELINNPYIDQAFQAANQYARSDDKRGYIEAGGWILMDRKGNLYYLIKPREERDTSTRVYGLGEPEKYIPNYSSGGDIVIADFHTHPNDISNPEEVEISNERGVPGIWVYPSGKAEAYGPNRGLLGKDLPKGCK